MRQYHDLLNQVLAFGNRRGDRTGTGTISLFGPQSFYDLRKGFPLVTTKKVFWRGVVEELLWMLRGSTNVRELQEKKVHIWDEWADENGELGRIYGAQFRTWETNKEHGLPIGKSRFEEIDQISNLIHRIKNKPTDRRLIVSAWNVGDLDSMKLPPCHCFFQCYVEDEWLSLKLYQRSADLFLGVPFNIASYALLTHILAFLTDLKPKVFIHTFGDAHIYTNHLEQVKMQLTREPRSLPKLTINNRNQKQVEDFKFEDFVLEEYYPHPSIKAPVAV